MMNDNNPKTRMGALKLPLHLVPPSAKAFLAMAMEDGANKYGPYNYREEKVSISTYYAAAQRHLDSFWDGENIAEDSNIHHIAHAMACCAIILDAATCGTLIDDRPRAGAGPLLQKQYHQLKQELDQPQPPQKEEADAS
jgi:hypothetical protein